MFDEGKSNQPAKKDMCLVRVEQLAVDPQNRSPFVRLENEDQSREMTIYIGACEAGAIITELEGVRARRPMTHDLLMKVVETLDAKIARVEIARLDEGTYFAHLVVATGVREVAIDARPSDSIALALRADAPIFAAEGLLSDAEESRERRERFEKERWKELLEEVAEQDSGGYEN